MENNRILKAKIIEHFGSQWRFAQSLGIHESVVSKVISRRRPLNDSTKQKWAKALNCDPEIFDRQ